MSDIDRTLLAEVGSRLGSQPELRFVVGAAGTGKTTVCGWLATRHGLPVLDMDERLYGSWHGRFDASRHPALSAWTTAPDPLAWLLALDPPAFVAWHRTTTAEALDLLATDLEAGRGDPGARALLVDGGFGSPAVLAAAVPTAAIACLSLPAAARAAVWTSDPERGAFLEMIAGVTSVPDPVARFLALDLALADAMPAEAAAAGVRVFERPAAMSVDTLALDVGRHLGTR